MDDDRHDTLPRWTTQEAETRFADLVRACRESGPQVVTEEGKDAVVVVPMARWRAGHPPRFATMHEWLTTDFARADIPVPERGSARRRQPIEFED